MKADAVLVLDFGGQYCHLISRRIREKNVFSEIVSGDISSNEINGWRRKVNVKGLILSGGPQSVFDAGAPRIDPQILDLGIPLLGLCYGHQLIAHMGGGVVKPAAEKEFGAAYVTIDKPTSILDGLRDRERVWMSHGDTIYSLPDDYEALAHTETCPVAAFRHKNRAVYGVQWHPEVVHTENGARIFKNFLFRICGCHADWTMDSFIDDSISQTKELIGDNGAIVALSGGIDSNTVTALAAKALGCNLTAVLVDHGFMRENEAKSVRDAFQNLQVEFIVADAKQRFLKRLRGVSDPEEKRRIIGKEFVSVFEEEARKVGAEYLLQGTIYPDRVESGSGKFSDKIKTHHNVAGLPTEMKFKAVVEPLRDLYKDEVREVAKKLGLPDELVGRQPFPGPGLAVRIMGEITEAKIKIARRADRIVAEEIEDAGLNDDLWQYFAVLTDSKSTGVKGDSRAYGYVVAVRVVESREAMTASFAEIPHEILERISSRITNEIPDVTRVVYDISHKPPATIEWE